MLVAIALIVWILVNIIPLDARARIAVGVVLILLLILGLLGVVNLPATAR